MASTLSDGQVPAEIRQTLDQLIPGLADTLDRTLRGVASALGGGGPRAVAGAMGMAVPPSVPLDFRMLRTPLKEDGQAQKMVTEQFLAEKLAEKDQDHRRRYTELEEETNRYHEQASREAFKARRWEAKYEWLRKKYMRERRQVARKQELVDDHKKLITAYQLVLTDVVEDLEIAKSYVDTNEKEGKYAYDDEEGLDYEEQRFEKAFSDEAREEANKEAETRDREVRDEDGVEEET